jgi:hypothetical protein
MNEISDEGPVLGSASLPMAATILLTFGIFVGYKTMRTDMRVGVAIMVGCALPAAFVAYQFIRLRRALGVAKLEMKDEVVPLGWSGTVTYVRPLHGATVESIEAWLQCEEHVEKGSGRSHQDWREVVVNEPIPLQNFPAMEQLRVTIPIKIPAAGPPTFHYTDNEINWWLRLHLKMDGCPSTRSSFKIPVMPAVVGR